VRVWFGKLSERAIFRDLERFLRPIGGAAGLPLSLLLLGDVSDRIGSDRFLVRTKLFDECRVPGMMKISGREPCGSNPLIVAASIMVARTVQRLMNVAD